MSHDKKGGGFNPPPLITVDPEAVELVTAAVRELEKRRATNDYCPRCNTLDWTVDPVAISVMPLRGVPLFPRHPGGWLSLFPFRSQIPICNATHTKRTT